MDILTTLDPNGSSNRLKLKAIHRFSSTATAVEDITAMQEGKVSKGLKQFLTEEIVNKGKGKEKLAVVDKTLGSWASALPAVFLCWTY